MQLRELIEKLEAEDPERVLPLGFESPHSWRGSYWELAFVPRRNVTVGECLEAARSAVGSTYVGYKGGEFTMDESTPVHLAVWTVKEIPYEKLVEFIRGL